LVDQHNSEVVLGGQPDQLLGHAVQDAGALGHVTKVLTEVEGNAVDNHNLYL